jgi:hypothetical protein
VTLHRVARCVHGSEDPDLDYFRVGIAENPDFSGWYLMFHGGPADAGASLPSEDYHLETETGAFAFGGLVSVILANGHLHLELTDAAARDLELPDNIVELSLQAEGVTVEQLGTWLARIFAGTSSRSRPHHLDLAGADLRSYGKRKRRKRKSKPYRVTFEVVRRRGTLVDARAVGQDRKDSPDADWLARVLGVAPDHLVGLRYTCLLTPDNWGTSYSDFRPIQGNPRSYGQPS